MKFGVSYMPLEAIVCLFQKTWNFLKLFTQECEFDFYSCFEGYVQLKNALSHREVASCEGELILPRDAVSYVVRAFHNFTSGFL